MLDRDLAMKGDLWSDRFPLLLLPFPLLSRSFLSVSATVSRNGYARARNTKGCVAFFSFLLSLPSSSRAVSLSLLAFLLFLRPSSEFVRDR